MTSTPPRPRQTSRYYAPGEVIAGKYELVRTLGEGGMGAVWLAKNLSLDSLVALKLLRAELDADDAAERLMQEARAAARIGHRAIVRVFDFGHSELGDPFIVMELLEGESLADILSGRGRLTAIKAVQMLLPIIDALSAAHARGIVHRDLKPDNIFLTREQRRTQPKVVDFGIAKVDQTGPARTLTRQGTVLGSPGYMSPEQARGLPGIDQRTDIWSICVVLYECITGTPAFAGDNYNALMRAIIDEPIVPSTSLAAGDARLWEILEKGLRKDRSERWQTMHDLCSELVRWLLDEGIDQDVCGEPITALLEPHTASQPRDILSVPPPSMLGGKRSPSGSETLKHGPDESGVQRSRGNRGTPVPGSTDAVTSSGIPAPLGRKPITVAIFGGFAFAALLVVLLFGHSESAPPAPASAAPPPVAKAIPVEPAVPAPAAPSPVVEPAPAAVAATTLSQPKGPSSTSRSSKKGPAGAHSGAAAPGAPRSQPAAPSAPSDLKDPY